MEERTLAADSCHPLRPAVEGKGVGLAASFMASVSVTCVIYKLWTQKTLEMLNL